MRRSLLVFKFLVVIWVLGVSVVFIKPLLDGYSRTLPEEQAQNPLAPAASSSSPSSTPAPITVLLIACNRAEALRRSLDLLLQHRPSAERFPIVVSQDCGHEPTREAILSYGDQLTLIEQPDLSPIDVPAKERKFKGYFYIARHYKWALDTVFAEPSRETVIIVEDDLDIAPDFYSYFAATEPLLRSDPSLWCVSAWNDNGKAGLVDTEGGAQTIYRSDFFPGLGWMLTRALWQELSPKWPRSYWDDWMRAPQQRAGRACLRPEVSRTRTFGKKGVSNGLFFDKHLKHIQLNEKPVDFSKLDLTGLTQEAYDQAFKRRLQAAKVVSLQEVTAGRLEPSQEYRVVYRTKEDFKRAAKAMALMDDFKAGVPRGGYLGAVAFMHGGARVFLAPSNNWRGYDPNWS